MEYIAWVLAGKACWEFPLMHKELQKILQGNGGLEDWDKAIAPRVLANVNQVISST